MIAIPFEKKKRFHFNGDVCTAVAVVFAKAPYCFLCKPFFAVCLFVCLFFVVQT